MKTQSLIDMLARSAGPAPRALVLQRLSPAALAGLAMAACAALALFGLVPAALFATAVPWMKMAYAGALALSAGWLTARLAVPLAPGRRPLLLTAAVVLAMAAAGAVSWAAEPAGAGAAALLGHSWFSCPWNVLALSLPALAALLWAVRGLAPIRPRAAGFAAGLTAGALGAFGYALSCPEASAAFVAVWYTLGVLLTGALGAALGPRALRW
jgi:hypothetical protein